MVSEIESRIDRIVGIYDKLHELIESLPIDIPDHIKKKTVDLLLGDTELKQLVDGIKNRRPPRFMLVGRTGVGKSSLINAMVGKYLVKTSDVTIGTTQVEKYSYEHQGRILFEILDTRGIGESFHTSRSAEDELKQAVKDWIPDTVLFLARAKGRDYLIEDIKMLKEINHMFNKDVPIVALSTQIDELEPSREKLAKDYSDRKQKNINEATSQLSKIFEENGLKPLDVIPISSYVEWNEDPTAIANEEWDKLYIEFDGRYNINKLLDLLEDNIDLNAGIFLMLSSRVDEVAKKISVRLTKIFVGVSSVIALSPIPLSDIIILLPIQSLLVMLIAYLSGRDLNFDTAKELLVSLGGAGAIGYGLRVLFQQGSKLFNLFFPGAGSAVSATIAGAGTYAIGSGAIAYFIQGASKEEVEKIVKRAHDEYKK